MGRRTQKLRAGKLRRGPFDDDPVCLTDGVPPPDTAIAHLGEASRAEFIPVQSDSVNHPSHYNMGGIEVIDAIEAWGLGFHLGNTVKYVARAEHKGKKLEDLKKARWYLDREIERLEKL